MYICKYTYTVEAIANRLSRLLWCPVQGAWRGSTCLTFSTDQLFDILDVLRWKDPLKTQKKHFKENRANNATWNLFKTE